MSLSSLAVHVLNQLQFADHEKETGGKNSKENLIHFKGDDSRR